MIVAAAVLPHPPLLLRELTGLVDPVPELREICRDAARAVLATAPEQVVVVSDDRPWRRPVGAGPHDGRPLGWQVGRRLLDEVGHGAAEHVTVAADATLAEVEAVARGLRERPGRLCLLVMGDGSACRGPLAPGFLDERAFAFDEMLAVALETGDRAALLGLDPALAAELKVAGRPAFQVLASVFADDPEAVLRWRGDPFGLSYFVAVWQALDGRSGPIS